MNGQESKHPHATFITAATVQKTELYDSTV